MIAIITGATGDIGEEFVKALLGEIDYIWAVGRSEEKLNALKEKYGEKIVPMRADLSCTKVVQAALKDCKRGKDVSVCSPLFRYLRLYSKLMPHKLVMGQWVRMIQKYRN